MSDSVFPADRLVYDEAIDLLAHYGSEAAGEARLRANRSRNLGNVLRFCHWRRTARTIAHLTSMDRVGTLH